MSKSYEEINEFLAEQERLITSANAPKNRLVIDGRRIVRAGSGRRAVFTFAEFPEGGDPRFRAVLAEMLRIHISKSSDYGTGADLYANYRSAEAIGIPAWKSCFVRALEKVQRLTNAAGGKKLNHEGISDSFLDLANHIVISKVLYDETQAKSGVCGNTDCDCSC